MIENTEFDVCVHSGDNKDINGLTAPPEASEGIGGEDALLAFRAKLTNERNGFPPGPDRELRTTLLNNLDGMIRDPEDIPLRQMFAENLTAYEARRAGRA